MSRVDAAAADRLPWLADEPASRPAKRRRGTLLPWTAATIVAAVAAGAFWVGVRSVNNAAPPPRQAHPSTTVPLPVARPAEPPQVNITAQPEVRPLAVPEVRPAPVRELHISPPRPVRTTQQEAKNTDTSEQGQATDDQKSAAAAPAAAAPAAAPYVPPKPWNPRVFAGAAGRVVQIGAFGSTRQAKLGWWYMVKTYPAVAHLPAVVRPTRNSKGRIFYRFQVGTTSQAHSEVLCQRMQRIRFSCAVVDLPGKAKVER